jgi:lipopolysaccharide biosynthesis glycosyltransferase
MPVLHLASAVNRHYLLPLAVLLDSIRQHHPRDIRIVFHVLHTGLSDQDLERLSSVADVHAIRINAPRADPLVLTDRFPIEASFPLYLADVLPSNAERVLFLDADTWVCDDLRSLWDVDMGDSVLAAVRDPAIPCCASPRGVKGWHEAGIPMDAPYFNAGVLLIQLARWRQLSLTGRALAYLRRHAGNVDFLHQEALNAVVWNQWHQLDERWNLPGSLTGRLPQRGSDAWRRPGIVHFAGAMKPWLYPIGGPFSAAYRTAMARVTSIFPPPTLTLSGRLKSLYDRHARAAAYPIETYLWRRRWL